MNKNALAALLSIALATSARSGEWTVDPFGPLEEGIEQVKNDLSLQFNEEELFAITSSSGRKPLLWLRPNQLEKAYLFSATMEKGLGERGFYSAGMMDTFVFYFHWNGQRVQMIRKGTAFRAEPGSPESRAIDNSFPDSILASLPVVSSDAARGAFAIPVEPLFMQDLLGLGAYLKEGPLPAGVSPEHSSVRRIRSFEKNTEVQVQLVFASAQPAGSAVLEDARLLPVTLHYSITELPQNPSYEPRAADARVGYFVTSYKDYSSKKLREKVNPVVHLINRWHLEKKDPSKKISDVKNPVVFWMEGTIPKQYRPAIRKGILAWNAAFRALGFRNAIVVKEVDKDMPAQERASFDPANAAYNVVRWFMGTDAGFAQGPSRANPFTGEIFNATVRIADVIGRFMGEERLAAVYPRSKSKPRSEDEYLSRAVEQAAASLAALKAQGRLNAKEKKRFMDQFVAHVMAHEIGHNLGLRHNFKASLVFDPKDPDGRSGSVMDYLPANIAAKGEKQGAYYQTKLGPYDYWAIEYGYKPASRRQLERIARRSEKDSRLAYGTDEDTDLDLDPDSQRWGLGSDHVDFAAQRIALVKDLWKNLEQRAELGKDKPEELRHSFLVGFSSYYNAVEQLLPLIGGVRNSRGRLTPEKKSFEPVPASEQYRALELIDEQVFSARPFQLSPVLLRSMGIDRTGFEWKPNRPLPLGEMALDLRRMVLAELYDPERLVRLSENASLSAKPSESLSIAELFSKVRGSIWKELSGSRAIDPSRRELQREHLAVLIETLEAPEPGDAGAAARADLLKLSSKIARRLAAGGLDAASRSHLKDVQERIRSALKPSVGA